ncbi:MAG: hypothetical protein ACRC9P_05380 [Bacteroides sp.]
MKDLNKLSKEIYEANKAKGFHDKEHSVEHMMCLVISELMEAIEADRKGRKADAECVKALTKQTSKSLFDVLFKNGVKDSVEDELADAVIRLLDTAGALDLALYSFSKDSCDYVTTKGVFDNCLFTESVFIITKRLLNNPLSLNLVISSTIFDIGNLCEVMGIDLWQHVDMKLKYNSLRPYKHGKKY